MELHLSAQDRRYKGARSQEGRKIYLGKVFIVSGVEIENGGKGAFASDFLSDKISYDVEKADGEKCERCWMYSRSVGKNALYPTLCERCAAEVAKILK